MQGESDESKHLDSVPRDKFITDYQAQFKYNIFNGFYLPEHYSKLEDAIENFEVRDDDIWVCTFLKAGTTWTQEMVWCIANDLDFEGAKVMLPERFPYMEYSMFPDHMPTTLSKPDTEVPEYVTDSVSYTKKLPSPRFIKTHLPYELLPRQIRDGTKKPKIVFVSRNPKDTCISYFYHSKLLMGYRGNFDDFCKLFIADKVAYAPFWKHTLGYLSRRNDENMLILTYEDMKTDLASVIRKVADFLGKSIDGSYDSKNVELLMKHLSFESMKVNPAVNYESLIDNLKASKMTDPDGCFIRSGEKDQWKEKMSREMIEALDEWTLQNTQGTCLASQ